MKKLLTLILIAATLFCFATNTFAALPETIAPMWVNIRQMSNDLVFNGTSGIADTMVFGKSGTTRITGTLTVYVQTSNGWEEVDSTSGSSTSLYLSMTINFTGIPGEYYKSVLNVTVTINGVNESETKTAYEYCPITTAN
ncbi:MAG: hypothetical protein E7627_04165 [Ruminococcaceae bacterium]|nr:hypothetical protein [Oscillospiraceae bacterium]